jgi:hypothetical protein
VPLPGDSVKIPWGYNLVLVSYAFPVAQNISLGFLYKSLLGLYQYPPIFPAFFPSLLASRTAWFVDRTRTSTALIKSKALERLTA